MSARALEERARAAGVILDRPGENAAPVPEATMRALADMLGEAPDPPPSAHRAAFVPEWLDHTRTFGVALQLYQLRSARNLGIGDLGDLKALIDAFAEEGADFVGLNPLHALFTADPERASPFSPSDRRFLNPMIIAVDEVPGYSADLLGDVLAGRGVPPSDERVDYAAVVPLKLAVLRAIHRRWRAGDRRVPDAARRAAVRFADRGGGALMNFAVFEALSHHMVAAGHPAGWWDWPAAYHDPTGEAVRAFAATEDETVDFHVWLQFIADDQLAATQAAARAAGMRIGLYLDLAVGSAPDGAATWSDPGLTLRGLRIGAPPDLFSLDGQDWGLAPMSPTALVTRDFEPYLAILAAVMGNAGAVRIDHAMGLERLFLIPDDMPAVEGAYVRQPGLVEEVVAATHAHRAIAIGEDLGVVPVGFRERMVARRIFSTRILSFERDGMRMIPPARYPGDALACLSTHDMAPLAAWWLGDEIELRLDLGRIDERVARHERSARLVEKQLLLALSGLPATRAEGRLDDAIVVAFHRTLARTRSRLMAVRLEDVVGGRRLVNLPGTDHEHPNWRHTLPLDVEAVKGSELLRRVLRTVREARGG
ncbi:4-alpha-glucanotransferase [Acuticoccus mangrovi]|uniref:4-alpha-glucanotransferase n=1 Tax=Acuticoccus mangrovi TaxID=2796142 RepID=A0A934MF13_9HYPH|nr:4-alpha-glucanotransferase [Acuticoccus mangrovi]MBJ3774973.1 4-alpha-glucanotransferase [Acuticoccus mangrovi]